MSTTNRDRGLCDECGRALDPRRATLIDGKPVCENCLHGDSEPVTIRPIGLVVNDKKSAKKGFGITGGDLSEIHLYPGIARLMKGVDEESHLTIVWLLHETRSVETEFARGWDGKLVGPFASRTPHRLTPIAITDVELVEVKGTTLVVRGLDAENGTAVLDIKVGLQSLRDRGSRP